MKHWIKRSLWALSLFPLGAMAGQPAVARGGLTGEQVYLKTCMACHEAGVANAPRPGDKAAWKPLIAEGQDVLTAHAWVGVRAMPPQGGNPELALPEFARAVAYMASKSGADWKEPDRTMFLRIAREANNQLQTSIRRQQAMQRELYRMSRTAP